MNAPILLAQQILLFYASIYLEALGTIEIDLNNFNVYILMKIIIYFVTQSYFSLFINDLVFLDADLVLLDTQEMVFIVMTSMNV